MSHRFREELPRITRGRYYEKELNNYFLFFIDTSYSKNMNWIRLNSKKIINKIKKK